ncbi:unnamed protein product [marine sediment metagenome]|uniref:Uncharacterized protein n=1 Tax=marine sediment metagenome TaxID=412755 RepID=X0SY42_9ZZZZ
MKEKSTKTKDQGCSGGISGRGIGLGKRNEMAHPEFPDKTLEKAI